VDIVVKGRNVEVPEHFRNHVADKLQKIERYDEKLIEVNVELSHERNPRQSGSCQRVEITCVSRGPVVRAEACAADFYSALDVAIAKVDSRLRRAADRRRVHRGRHAPISVAEATAPLAALADLPPVPGSEQATPSVAASVVESSSAPSSVAVAERDEAHEPSDAAQRSDSDQWGNPYQGGDEAGGTETRREPTAAQVDLEEPFEVVRMKEHPAEPMTVDDALFQMEMVGHDFYLFLDKDSGRPSVVYRRKGYHYGVICLGEGM
jgi:ribosomal subunit interface protein